MAASIRKQVLARAFKLSHFLPTFAENAPKSCRQNVRLYVTVIEAATPDIDLSDHDDEFRVLIIPGHTKIPARKRIDKDQWGIKAPPARSLGMKTDQDWTSVWPTASTFKWSVVPFPVRQGMAVGEENDGVSPKKYANAELMKIPNFLHLTPKHIRQHCAAMKKFCTPWPQGLRTDEDCDRHFPVEVLLRDYMTDGPSLRDTRSRTVTVKVKLSVLGMDDHSRDKLLRLVGDRYDPVTDMLTLTSDRCPLKQQNYDYCMYLLTAIYHESWNVAAWESQQTVADMSKYVWDVNKSKTSLVTTLQAMKAAAVPSEAESSLPSYLAQLPEEVHKDDRVAEVPEVSEYKNSVEEIQNDGENVYSWDKYKDSVRKLLLSTT